MIAELASRGVGRDHIASGARHLAQWLGTERPFAHKGLATVEVGFFAEVAGDWEDAGLRGQVAFQRTIADEMCRAPVRPSIACRSRGSRRATCAPRCQLWYSS